MTAGQTPAAPAAPAVGGIPDAPQLPAAPAAPAGGGPAARSPADLTPVLTPKERELLDFLRAHPGRVFTRRALLAAVWGVGADLRTRTVDQHVAALRRKCALDGRLLTVYRQGYLYQAG